MYIVDLYFLYPTYMYSFVKLNDLKFLALEVESRYRDPQLQMGDTYLFVYLRPNICKS